MEFLSKTNVKNSCFVIFLLATRHVNTNQSTMDWHENRRQEWFQQQQVLPRSLCGNTFEDTFEEIALLKWFNLLPAMKTPTNPNDVWWLEKLQQQVLSPNVYNNSQSSFTVDKSIGTPYLEEKGISKTGNRDVNTSFKYMNIFVGTVCKCLFLF